MGTSFLHVLFAGVDWDYHLRLPDGTISCMGTSFLHVSIAGVERDYPWWSHSLLLVLGWDYPLRSPGDHIPCMGTSFPHEMLAGVELGDSFKLPGSHIPYMGTSFLHVFLPCALWDVCYKWPVLPPFVLWGLLHLMSDDHKCNRNISYPGANCYDESFAYP